MSNMFTHHPTGTFQVQSFNDYNETTYDVLSGFLPRLDLMKPPKSQMVAHVEWDNNGAQIYGVHEDGIQYYVTLSHEVVIGILMAKGYSRERAEEILSLNT